jgi:phenylacetate-CoA ligase
MTDLMEPVIRRVTHPLWARRNHPNLYSFLKEYEQTQFWSPERIRDLQWQRLQRIVRFAFERCPYYTRRFQEIGFSPNDLRDPSDFLKLPVLTREDIRQNQDALLASGIPSDRYEDNFTGGSTGSPIAFKVSKLRWASRKATTQRHDCWTGWNVGKRLGILWGHPGEHADETARGRLRNALLYRHVLLNTFDVKEPSLGLFLDEIRAKKVRYLQAYSRSLLLFAEYISKRAIELPLLEAAITSAECLTPSERKFIERTLRCRTFDRYGCREFSVIASECQAHDGLHIAAENLLVEFLVGDRPVRSDEVGEILVTDLSNEVMPFIRYRIGDMGAPMDGMCSCGRGLPRMQMVAGRVTDFVHTPNGRWLSGVAINTYLIAQIPGVRQAQILQEKCDHIRFRLISSGPDVTSAENFLHDQVKKMFGAGMSHSVEWVSNIAPEASGKTRVTISRCTQTHGLGSFAAAADEAGFLQRELPDLNNDAPQESTAARTEGGA